jgi:hypothetical protein
MTSNEEIECGKSIIHKRIKIFLRKIFVGFFVILTCKRKSERLTLVTLTDHLGLFELLIELRIIIGSV